MTNILLVNQEKISLTSILFVNIGLFRFIRSLTSFLFVNQEKNIADKHFACQTQKSITDKHFACQPKKKYHPLSVYFVFFNLWYAFCLSIKKISLTSILIVNKSKTLLTSILLVKPRKSTILFRFISLYLVFDKIFACQRIKK